MPRGYLGRTPLMESAQICTPNLAELYLEHGADPAIKDTRGQTALDHASGRSGEGFDPCPEVIELLLEAQETPRSMSGGPAGPSRLD